MSALPHFENQFLNELVKSYLKRRKGLSYNAHSVELTKSMDIVDGVKVERLEINLESSKSKTKSTFRMYVWPDRWIWIDARKRGRVGWAWEFETEGRLQGNRSTLTLIENFKEFYSESRYLDADKFDVLAQNRWDKILARGPSKI